MAKLTPETEATHPGCLPLELPAPRAAEPRHQATCVGRVALAITRQGSHRSVRAHIRAYGSSTSRFAARKGPEAIRSSYGDMAWNLEGFRMVPSIESAG